MANTFFSDARIGRVQPSAANLDQTLIRLGGEERLKQKYPELYKAVLNTRSKNGIELMSQAKNEGSEYIFGTSDSCKIRTLNYSPDTTLETSSSIATDKVEATLAIVGEIIDMNTGKSVDGFAVSDNNTDSIFAQSITDSSELASGQDKRFKAKSSFLVVSYDETGKPVVKSLNSEMEAQKTLNEQYIVKSLIVNDPMPIKHAGADKTTVYYNRNGREADYMYANVKFDSTSIDAYMPFSGCVELNGIYQPDPTNPIVTQGDNNVVLQIENLRNGAANFDLQYLNEAEFKVTGSVLEWKFPINWHDIISKNRLTCANDMDFYCKMYINTTIGIAVPITIQSSGGTHKDPSYKKIPYINIMWGCFAKDTRIQMADGSVRYIEAIRPGDRVLTRDDGMQTVQDVVTGTEERLVYIETSRGSSIKVTDDHPLLTLDGMVRADKLTAGSILVTPDGDSSIEALHYVNYFDTVYNLVLEKEAILVANDLYAGDMNCQNRQGGMLRKAFGSGQKLEGFQEELADLIAGLNRKEG